MRRNRKLKATKPRHHTRHDSQRPARRSYEDGSDSRGDAYDDGEWSEDEYSDSDEDAESFDYEKYLGYNPDTGTSTKRKPRMMEQRSQTWSGPERLPSHTAQSNRLRTGGARAMFPVRISALLVPKHRLVVCVVVLLADGGNGVQLSRMCAA